MTIKIFFIEYDAINSRNTFTNGDKITGRIIFETRKETKIQSLTVTAKGKAQVSFGQWEVVDGRQTVYCHFKAEEKYYEVTHSLRAQGQDGFGPWTIGPGRHAFPFTFIIPDEKIPSSFEASAGKIVHKLKAKLKRSMKPQKTSEIHFRFVSKADMNHPILLQPQRDSRSQNIHVFGSGNVSLDVRVNKMGYHPGDSINVTAEIRNNSGRSVKPKFVLYESKSFHAQGAVESSQREVFREKCDAMEASSVKNVSKTLLIPRDMPISIVNSNIIKLQYFLKVYLDIKFCPDPTITLPIIILPKASERKRSPAANFGSESSAGPNRTGQSTTPQQATHQFMDQPPSYETYPLYPPLSHNKL
ncbi:unnamed protein product [Ophioblennius macclurei]